jgi:anaerobic ribonucleoside-triphosphate reductase activating protein
MVIRVHAFEPGSRTNGPGLRAVVWFQGCTLACPGCFNPATHDPAGGYEADAAALVSDILALRQGIEGLTVSGGEPFQQPEALLDLLGRLDGSALGRLVFTGYTLEEVLALPLGRSALAHVDAIIAGRYVAALRLARGLMGSANQTIHLLSGRYGVSDFAGVPGREAIIHRDGSITLSGIDPWQVAQHGRGEAT